MVLSRHLNYQMNSFLTRKQQACLNLWVFLKVMSQSWKPFLCWDVNSQA